MLKGDHHCYIYLGWLRQPEGELKKVMSFKMQGIFLQSVESRRKWSYGFGSRNQGSLGKANFHTIIPVKKEKE